MRKLSRRDFIVVTTGGLVASYAAAACGSDDDDGDGAPPTSAATTAPTSAATSPGASATVDAGVDNGAAGLRWFGQSMFLLESPGGTTVLLDPFNDIGYTIPPPLDTDAATITHEHPDHNNGGLAGTAATVLKGLTADGWADIDETFGDVRIRSVRTFHDAAQGSERGRNAVFVFETAGLTIAHLGDLGHVLDDEQIASIGPVDVLMVPVGGAFTIDAAQATEVTQQLSPSAVFPMHYKTDKIAFPLATAEAFLAGKTVQQVGDTTIRVARDNLPPELTAYVLNFE
jgi:L-ascorbate metabolism protein UlaG (beta-lactamase superfamily)